MKPVHGCIVDAAGSVWTYEPPGVDLAQRLEKLLAYYTKRRDNFEIKMPLRIHRCHKKHNVGETVSEHE